MHCLLFGFLIAGVLTQATAQECGQRKATSKHKFVIGGEDARRGDWPWQVWFLTHAGSSLCSGSLIHPQWVVTAAQCVTREDPQNIVLRFGDTNRSINETTEVERRVSQIIAHPEFSWRTVRNDIAVVKLDRPVAYTNYIQPICMAGREAPDGTPCYITGWGKTRQSGNMVQKLQQGLLPKQPRSVCAAYNERKLRLAVTQEMICGAQPGTVMSGCHGDSGGPYVCKMGTRWELHGAVSWGSPSCDARNTYTVFANIAFFRNWIEEQVQGNGGPGERVDKSTGGGGEGEGEGDLKERMRINAQITATITLVDPGRRDEEHDTVEQDEVKETVDEIIQQIKEALE